MNRYIALLLNKRDSSTHYAKALSLFEQAENCRALADRTFSTAERLDYLTMQRECLQSTLADLLLGNNPVLWARKAIQVMDITDEVNELVTE